MHPNIVLNGSSLALAFVACFFFGFLWYGPLFGKHWAKWMGFNPTRKPKPSEMQRGLLLQTVGLCLTVYVMAHSSQVWRASVWNAGSDMASWKYGFYAGLFTWLGFYLPQQFGKVAWENRPWKLFFLNTTHDFINLQIMAMIVSCSCHR